MQRSISEDLKTSGWKKNRRSWREIEDRIIAIGNSSWKLFLRVEIPMRFAASVEGIRIYTGLLLALVFDGERFVSVATWLVINRDGGQYRRDSFLRLL